MGAGAGRSPQPTRETPRTGDPSAADPRGDDPRGDDPLSDAVRRFQSGEDREGAFRFLYERFFPPVRRFFARKGMAPEDCLDLTQDTFLRVYKGLEGYEHRQQFAAWLFRIATTTYLKRLRRARAAKRRAVEVSKDGMDDPARAMPVEAPQLDGVIDGQRRRALRAAIAELPDQQRDCLTLRLVHQLSYDEIATVKKLSPEAVKAHLFRGRRRLRDELGGLDDVRALDDEEAP